MNSGPEHYLPLSLRFGSRRIICKNAVQQAARYHTTQTLLLPSPTGKPILVCLQNPPLLQAKKRKKEIKPKHKSYHEGKTKYKTLVSDVVLIVLLLMQFFTARPAESCTLLLLPSSSSSSSSSFCCYTLSSAPLLRGIDRHSKHCYSSRAVTAQQM